MTMKKVTTKVLPINIFCPNCHSMFGLTKDGEKRCRRCEAKYYAEPKKKVGGWGK